MKKFSGSFYFKMTTNGNLMGEFSNNQDGSVHTESATRTAGSAGFEGTYTSTWFDGSLQGASLEISRKGTSNQFELKWTGANHPYSGEGFLADEMLIGYYEKE